MVAETFDEERSSHRGPIYGQDEHSISRAGSVYNAKSIVSAAHTSVGELPLDLNEELPQFTVKAMISGVVAGTLCTFLALYYGLKVGITPSLNILGATVGYGVAIALVKLPWFGTHFTPQENAVIQTVSVAVYSVACPAFGFANGWLGLSKEAYEAVGDMDGNLIEDTVDINWWRSVVWSVALFAFGFFIAYPLKNYYIVKKRLFFPSGTATAYIIQSLHDVKAGGEDTISFLSKFFALAFSVNMAGWCFSGINDMPIFGMVAYQFGWALDFDLGSFGIGMLLSLMTNGSMLLGAFVIYGILQPYLHYNKDGDFPGAWFDSSTFDPNTANYRGLYNYALFSGLALMIVQGIWGIGALLYTVISEKKRERQLEHTDPDTASPLTAKRDRVFLSSDFPVWVPFAGYVIFGALCAIIMHFLLDTVWYQTLIALIVVPVFACSNIEGMGRTDWDVASSYGKLVMFPIGAWNKGKSIIPSVSICHTTISGCSNSAMLMQDFKTGYLLGANPSIMFYAQFIGCFLGCLITPSLFLLLRSVYTIPTTDSSAFIQGKFGYIYRSLAIVATGSGFESLPKNCLWIAFGFMLIALVFNILGIILPEKIAKWIPDPSAMSIGMLIGAVAPLEFFIGGALAAWWEYWDPATCARNKAYIASGTIAGSGVAIVVQCIMSLASVNAPVAVSYVVGYEGPSSAGAKAVGTIVVIICIGVLACGLWFWFPAARLQPHEASDEAQPLRLEVDDDAESADEEESGTTTGPSNTDAHKNVAV
eukprot:Gregarina_sp_Poly_1__9814@NODE_629_length_7064_cov_625_434043_g482_i0_p1_GENE_NODE_629_length_7064_cov_625_434043_g482_i0NODE_629_length_7064_cov_625_434043_g482_i0_p1_ORF_typecomplete_len763_score91_58OPT/PF03169_15/1_9e84DUF3040/PF11239_8/1_5e04DUF3040/PF11239_8/3_1e03DUF3040/PF11239_8/0_55DUF3040/PF11239_8/1_8e03DUF3040/PF11239_8/1_8e04DUF202/PF02656_15/9_2e03DUF202/PF02656_15/1_6e04DUF202/PF02656_15/2_8e03DUF202/PF02656_15/8_5e03DUF202/PF02656_15/1_3e03DUF202/PF02656_15/5_1DUF1475/PF07343_11